MCVNYSSPEAQHLRSYFRAEPPFGKTWRSEVWNHYEAPFIVASNGERQAHVGEYGLVPKDKQPIDKKTGKVVNLSTMNARDDRIAMAYSYKQPWRDGQTCLVPCTAFYEPNWETGKHVSWRIHLVSDEPFAVAGIWKLWDAGTEKARYAFSQITVNADDHPFMRRFHRPGEEKRSLVILRPDDYDAWLNCRDPEIARTFLQTYPAELMLGEPKLVPRA